MTAVKSFVGLSPDSTSRQLLLKKRKRWKYSLKNKLCRGVRYQKKGNINTGNPKEGSITVPLTSCLTYLESAV
jgi:hypothetical protein